MAVVWSEPCGCRQEVPQYHPQIHRSLVLQLNNFSVVCHKYQDRCPDGDVYTWWQQPPMLRNEEVLRHLTSLKRKGLVRPDAQAVVLFDQAFSHDMRSLQALRRNALWLMEVPYDEMGVCQRSLRSAIAKGTVARKAKDICSRAKGVFSVGGFGF